MMRIAILAFAVPFLIGLQLALAADDDDEATRAEWRSVFDGIAADYRLHGEAQNESLTLFDSATYTWARSGPHGGTYGSVYVWTNHGNAEAVACFWRNPGTNGQVSVVHELHSLSPDVLNSTGKDSESWKPKAGVKRYPLVDAPSPASSPIGRLQQMRALCRDFSAHSMSVRGERTELRLLPQPLYRFNSTDPNVVDGALFAFVCSIGTDPEVFLQLEARDLGDGPRWHYTLARFSHMDLHVQYRGKEVWQALRDQENTMAHNADYTYWVFHQPLDRIKPGVTKKD